MFRSLLSALLLVSFAACGSSASRKPVSAPASQVPPGWLAALYDELDSEPGLQYEPSWIHGTGSLTKREVKRVVETNLAQLQWCYDTAVEAGVPFSGKVHMQWVVAPNGAVRDARTAYVTAPPEQLTECFVSKMRRWRFPEPRGGAVAVRYPFEFRSMAFD